MCTLLSSSLCLRVSHADECMSCAVRILQVRRSKLCPCSLQPFHLFFELPTLHVFRNSRVVTSGLFSDIVSESVAVFIGVPFIGDSRWMSEKKMFCGYKLELELDVDRVQPWVGSGPLIDNAKNTFWSILCLLTYSSYCRAHYIYSAINQSSPVLRS